MEQQTYQFNIQTKHNSRLNSERRSSDEDF